ncbi:Cathepsin_L [Hexamita inflata]|uniref:Cathepsin L n=1 Tax=Hexamita inflata TaxID=28002 RepID=A0AA86NZH9_9EUKA|nr:Cathepsin L [Hexamita inflata]
MIALFQYTLLNNLIQMTCDEAFAEYTLKFNKMYSSHEEEKKSIFCTNFLELQELLLTDPNLPVGLVERMDVVHQETVLKAKNSPLNQLQAARNDYCSAINPLPDLSTVYPSVDLREMQLITSAKNQGQCGCCYVFQTMAVLENAVLRDKNNLNSFWQNKADSATLSLSEQFQLSNAICKTCNYCKGGNFDMYCGTSCRRRRSIARLILYIYVNNVVMSNKYQYFYHFHSDYQFDFISSCYVVTTLTSSIFIILIVCKYFLIRIQKIFDWVFRYFCNWDN